jgi:sugar transferase (PEP-CTERM/EpsH1 system associated)
MERPLIAHVIHYLGMGGLENGLVNLINRIPEDQYRHVIVCMTGYTDFSRRIQKASVEIVAIHKQPGHDLRVFPRLFRLFRRLKPAIVHSRNLSALDSLLPATLAGVPCRIHGEHGWDVDDLDGSRRKYQWLRRIHKSLVDVYVPLSKDMESYLHDKIRVPEHKIRQIYNGVDTQRFHPATHGRERLPLQGFAGLESVVIGTVGRLQPVKDQLNLVDAFVYLVEHKPELRSKVRLVIVGDGPLREQITARLKAAAITDLVWLPGSRDDVPTLLRCFDIFVLPSLAEGISNTLLEAMACGLPVIATDVGGNRELVRAGETGLLVPPANPVAMAEALGTYVYSQSKRCIHGQVGRRRVETCFSLEQMVQNYILLYDEVLNNKGYWTLKSKRSRSLRRVIHHKSDKKSFSTPAIL